MPASFDDDTELAREQSYFDRAWEARERSRQNLGQAASSVGGKASVALGRAAQAHMDQIGAADEGVAIGRFDEDGGETFYVGRRAITDAENNLLVISWQAKAAAPFYTATVDDPAGLAMRRTFEVERNRLISFKDEVFADLANRVQSLTALEKEGIDDAVLRDLEAGRSGEMRDIVQTIHAMQYELIRTPLEQLLIVEGGPGTGKTVVGLHRVSWLLFNNPTELTSADVLVIGPNPTFTRYIRQVLPGLGDHQIEHRDLRTLGPQASTGRAEGQELARLKGDIRMSGLLSRGLVQRVRFPDRTDRLDVGSASEPLASLTRSEVEAFRDRAINQSRSYLTGRAAMRSWIATTVAGRVRRGVEVPSAAVDAALERVWPSITPQAFLRDLLGSRDRLRAAGERFSPAELAMLQRSASERISDEQWSLADVALLDEVDAMLGGSDAGFGHIVLDEAQDLSAMQLRSISRRSRNGSYTLLGDLAQSTGPWARDSWDDVVAALRRDYPVRIVALTLGYRVPQQVFALAAQLLPHSAPAVEHPTVIRLGPSEPDLRRVGTGDLAAEAVRAAADHAGRGRFVGIICAASHHQAVAAALTTADVHFQDTQSGLLGASVNLVVVTEAKGLEFEAVVVIEPEAIVEENPHGLRLLYVALTRTTKYLTVVHTGRVLPIPVHDSPDGRRPVAVAALQAEPQPTEQTPSDEAVDEQLRSVPGQLSIEKALLEAKAHDSTDELLSSDDVSAQSVTTDGKALGEGTPGRSAAGRSVPRQRSADEPARMDREPGRGDSVESSKSSAASDETPLADSGRATSTGEFGSISSQGKAVDTRSGTVIVERVQPGGDSPADSSGGPQQDRASRQSKRGRVSNRHVGERPGFRVEGHKPFDGQGIPDSHVADYTGTHEFSQETGALVGIRSNALAPQEVGPDASAAAGESDGRGAVADPALEITASASTDHPETSIDGPPRTEPAVPSLSLPGDGEYRRDPRARELTGSALDVVSTGAVEAVAGRLADQTPNSPVSSLPVSCSVPGWVPCSRI